MSCGPIIVFDPKPRYFVASNVLKALEMSVALVFVRVD
jgi:hypothetical protein